MGWNFLKLDEEDKGYIKSPIKECLFPRQNGKSTLLKKEIMEKYGYEDASEETYDLTYCNPTWLSLITKKCDIYGIVEKAKYVIYFFTENDMISYLDNTDVLKETELELNKLDGQEFIDKVNDIENSVKVYLMYKGLSDKEVKNED